MKISVKCALQSKKIYGSWTIRELSGKHIKYKLELEMFIEKIVSIINYVI